MVNDSTMERLVFIKQLYLMGVEQSRRPEPANAVAVLMFHDAVDLLLQLASEYLNVGKSGNTYLMEYFNLLAPKVEGGAIDGRQSMKRLDGVRKNLKHHGTRPAAGDVESLRASTTSFFETNVLLFFGITFDEIAMSRLVVVPEARKSLEESEALAAAGDLGGSVEATAIAFAQLMSRHHQLEPVPYRREHRTPIRIPGSGGVDRIEFDVRDIDKDVQKLSQGMETLQERVTFLSLGVEPASLARFKRTAPEVHLSFNGTPRMVGRPKSSPVTIDDVRFCYDFVIGVALALQRRW